MIDDDSVGIFTVGCTDASTDFDVDGGDTTLLLLHDEDDNNDIFDLLMQLDDDDAGDGTFVVVDLSLLPFSPLIFVRIILLHNDQFLGWLYT